MYKKIILTIFHNIIYYYIFYQINATMVSARDNVKNISKILLTPNFVLDMYEDILVIFHSSLFIWVDG